LRRIRTNIVRTYAQSSNDIANGGTGRVGGYSKQSLFLHICKAIGAGGIPTYSLSFNTSWKNTRVCQLELAINL